MQQLLPDLTTWSYDRAGEGASSPVDEWSVDGSVADLSAWMSALGVSMPIVLVGHSLGCHIVRTYADRHPESVDALLLIDPRPPHFELRARDAGIEVPLPPPASSVYKQFARADDLVAGLPVPSHARAASLCSEQFDGGPPDLSDDQKAALAELWRQAQDEVARSIGQTSAEVVAGTGHMIPIEAPDFVAATIRRTLR